ncbi:ATP-binding protein [Pseudonocardia sp.]|uniref:HAMP domain-containing sensor histidine kinase n=1 Tax=Pseudonocardia sp. TaxID=60912 RepID=UPI003D0F4197
MRRVRGWWARRAGVRVRTAGTAAIVVAVALALGGAAMLLLLDRSLESVEQDEARVGAAEVADALAAGVAPQDAVGRSRSVVALVQVLDARGAALAASPSLAGRPPLVAERPAPGTEVSVRLIGGSGTAGTDPDGGWLDPDDVAVAVRGVATADGDLVVVVGEPLGSVGRSVAATAELLAIAVPLLALVAAITTYVATGRALRPVEAMRAQVELITDRDLDQHVVEPAARDEVGRLAVTLNAMLARLRAARAAQRQLVADASHELRSPLTTVVAGLELTRGRTERDDARIAAMAVDAARIGHLVEDLLLLARADERGLRPGGDGAGDDVDLDELLDAERLRLRSVSTVEVVTVVAAARVRGDRGQLARLVRNLVDNAVRHAAGVVELHLSSLDGTVELAVGDDGPGIPVADRERVLRRFVRLDPGRARDAGGSGLGLAIVTEVAHAHGGTVEVGRSPRGGALVTVRLPAAG